MVAILVAVLAVLFIVVLSVEIYRRYRIRILRILYTSPKQRRINSLSRWNKFLEKLRVRNVRHCDVKMMPGSPHAAIFCNKPVENGWRCAEHIALDGQHVNKYHMVGRYEKGTEMYEIAAVTELQQRFKYRKTYNLTIDPPHQAWEDKLTVRSSNHCIVDHRIITVEERDERKELAREEQERANDEARERAAEEEFAEEQRRLAEDATVRIEIPEEHVHVDNEEENWDDDKKPSEQCKQWSHEDETTVWVEKECAPASAKE